MDAWLPVRPLPSNTRGRPLMAFLFAGLIFATVTVAYLVGERWASALVTGAMLAATVGVAAVERARRSAERDEPAEPEPASDDPNDEQTPDEWQELVDAGADELTLRWHRGDS